MGFCQMGATDLLGGARGTDFEPLLLLAIDYGFLSNRPQLNKIIMYVSLQFLLVSV